MRPALDGHAGIPQETRLLFHGLQSIDGIEVAGLIQHAGRVLARGMEEARLAKGGAAETVHAQFDRLSQVVISLQSTPGVLIPDRFRTRLRLIHAFLGMAMRQALGMKQPLTHFDPENFRDFIWRALFARTLEPSEFERVTGAPFRVASIPWNALHGFGMLTRGLSGRAMYPKLDTAGYDIMIGETPYPARVSGRTRMIVRYHDAVPILMPHTIINTARHQAMHYNALRSNVRSGAFFACVSEATRQDLLTIFPEVASRAVTIPNMVSPFYRHVEISPEGVLECMRTRLHTEVKQRGIDEKKKPFQGLPRYLLMVSTLEPRKNHLGLLAAWERMRAQGDSDLKLVLVGQMGWGNKELMRRLRPWLDRGSVLMLENVPSDELRALYRYAAATVCPSLFEGFDFSGIEAMRCGGVVVASDIPVHREIFAEGSEYFSPYSIEETAEAITKLISPGNEGRRDELRRCGEAVSARFLPDRIIPKWKELLREIESQGRR